MVGHRGMLWLALACVSVAQLASANDADVSVGGSPQLLDGHRSVRMEREKIVMKVGPKNTTVVCDFWFRNDGQACTVRMGFPDEGNAGEETDPEGKPPSNFTYFKSWVGGKRVTTRLLRGQDGVGWHVKVVRFPAHSTLRVRDAYTATIDSGIASAGESQGGCLMALYTVHTGSSWKGTIGRTEIQVDFDRSFAPHGIRAVPAKRLSKQEDGRRLGKAPFPRVGTIVYHGIGVPRIKGRALRFLRTNWRPTRDDDLQLWFGYSGRTGD